ncbi:MAG: hypothetical protein IPL60_03010 [Ardenticatenia bacterium]|nr:hypothetical protein [Ardenticatenia bacterium]
MYRKRLMLGVLVLVTGSIAVLINTRRIAQVTEPVAQSGQSGGTQYPPGIRELKRYQDQSSKAAAAWSATAEAVFTPDTAPLLAIHSVSEYPLMITTAAQAESIVRGLMRNIVPTQLEVRLVKKSKIPEILANDELLGDFDSATFNDAPVWLVILLAPSLLRQSIGLEGFENVNQDTIDGVWVGLEADGGFEAGRGVVSPSARDWSYFVSLPSEALPILTPTP